VAFAVENRGGLALVAGNVLVDMGFGAQGSAQGVEKLGEDAEGPHFLPTASPCSQDAALVIDGERRVHLPVPREGICLDLHDLMGTEGVNGRGILFAFLEKEETQGEH